MGSLADLLSWVDNKRRVVGSNISDLVRNPRDYLSMTAANIPQTVKEYGEDPMNFVGGGIGHIAWHGSPHKFDKFSLDAIGTGEGAQAYGHGLYLAESPEVAKSYRNVLSDTLEVKGDALPIEKRAAQMALTFGDNTADGALKWLSKFEGKGANHTAPALTPEIIQSVKAKFADGSFSHGGALYKTDIPDEAVARFLDWDKPLSQQIEHLGKLSDAELYNLGITREGLDAFTGKQLTGGDLMRFSDNQHGGGFLNKKGIPGIRYLDGGSRSAGQGSSNFVAFDPEMIRILERNGQPTGLEPWKPGEYRPISDLLNPRTD